MTEPKPRKSLWEMMGQKIPEEVPAATTEPQGEAAPADQTPVPKTDSEAEPPLPAKGRGLWALMHHSESPEGDAPVAADDMRAAFEAPVKPVDKRLRQMAAAEADIEIVKDPTGPIPAKRIDKRLLQVQQPEVEIVDDDEETPRRTIDKRLQQVEELEVEIVEDEEQVSRPKIDTRLQQMEALDVEIVDDEVSDDDVSKDDAQPQVESGPRIRSLSSVRGIPSPLASRSVETMPAGLIGAIPVEPLMGGSAATGGRSNNALWSVILGILSLPISIIAIYPAMWSSIPASASGFAGLLLGFLAQQELTRTGQKGREYLLAYAGMATGLLGMFAGPLIYAPLDIYGRWSDSYTGTHLQQIGLATEAYFQQQHSFPAGGLFREMPDNSEPVPLHGWMTLLLPHLPEGASLARQIDLGKSYSDPANLPVMSQSVPGFLAAGGSMELIQGKYAPAHFAGLGGQVNLADGSVGHVGVFDANSETTREQVVDGLSNTLMAGEVSNKYPAWGEPRNWRRIGKGLNRDPEGFGNSRHTGAMFLMADGSVRYLPNQTDPKVLEALSTRDGEERP